MEPDGRAAAIAVVKKLRAKGHEAHFAGGCVRDELLGLEPGDFDVATDATPDRLTKMFRAARLVGAQFGVVQIRSMGVWTEVATFRSDGVYSDRRRPDDVSFGDAQADAERRDFTINALFLDPLAEEADWTTRPGGGRVAGRVIDLVGGLADLSAGIVRAVGDPHRRLAEDHLRALRAVRFAARLGFEIDPQTAHAIAEHARELEGVSRERIGGELRRMLAHGSRRRAAAMLEQLGLDGPMLEAPAIGAGRAHPRLGALPADARTMVSLAAWLLDRGKGGESEQVRPLVHQVRRALCLSNDESAILSACLARRLEVLAGYEEMGKARQKRLAASAGFREALAVIRAEDPGLERGVAERVEALAAEPGGLAPDRWVTGDDLISLGWRPGPGFARVLEDLYDLQLAGEAPDRASLLEHLAAMGVEPDGSEPDPGNDP
ncbi:MAG: CCA tRNA nucleotidyltransferase [Phycisphaerales bacterium]|jgi:poly(A) polymerase